MGRTASLSITMVRGKLDKLESAVLRMDLVMAEVLKIYFVYHTIALNIAVVADGDPFWGPFLKKMLTHGFHYSVPVMGVEVDLQGGSAEEALKRCAQPTGSVDVDAWRGLMCDIALLSLISSQEEAGEE